MVAEFACKLKELSAPAKTRESLMQFVLVVKPDKDADYLGLDRRHIADLLDTFRVIHCLPNLNDADARVLNISKAHSWMRIVT